MTKVSSRGAVLQAVCPGGRNLQPAGGDKLTSLREVQDDDLVAPGARSSHGQRDRALGSVPNRGPPPPRTAERFQALGPGAALAANVRTLEHRQLLRAIDLSH